MSSPDKKVTIPGWEGREVFLEDALTILRTSDTSDMVLQSVNVKGSCSNHIGLVKPLWHPHPTGRAVHEKGYWRPDRAVVAELISRMIEVRSRRWNKDKQLLADWPEEWQDLIRRAYPALKVGFSCHWGWADLICATAAWINERQPDADWSVSDVKEKFGTLRIYWSGDLDEVSSEVIDCAEHVSFVVCEICGRPGKVRKGSWLTCLCDEHDQDTSWRHGG